MCMSGTVGNMGNVGNVGTKNFQKNEKKPGAGPGDVGQATNNQLLKDEANTTRCSTRVMLQGEVQELQVADRQALSASPESPVD